MALAQESIAAGTSLSCYFCCAVKFVNKLHSLSEVGFGSEDSCLGGTYRLDSSFLDRQGIYQPYEKLKACG